MACNVFRMGTMADGILAEHFYDDSDDDFEEIRREAERRQAERQAQAARQARRQPPPSLDPLESPGPRRPFGVGGGLFGPGSSLASMMGGGAGFGPGMQPSPEAFRANYVAYSTSIHEASEGRSMHEGREHLMYGGYSEDSSFASTGEDSSSTCYFSSDATRSPRSTESVIFGSDLLRLSRSHLLHFLCVFTARMDIEGPWTFDLINPTDQDRRAFAGVLQFTAPPGTVYLPQWVCAVHLCSGFGTDQS